MGTAAWGGCGEGKCFRCNGWSWCGCHLQCPSLLHQTAVPPKLLGVSIIRLCGRTAQPSATPASPPVSMRGMINPVLHSASPKETSRWCVATQPRELLRTRIALERNHSWVALALFHSQFSASMARSAAVESAQLHWCYPALEAPGEGFIRISASGLKRTLKIVDLVLIQIHANEYKQNQQQTDKSNMK